MITLSQVQKAKKVLFKKHPLKFSVNTVGPNKKIADFIESCFFEDYGDEERQTFTPELLEDIDPEVSFAAKNGNKVVGVFVGIPYEGSVISTGLSVPKN
ncbi:MAG: hypothetical protein ACOCUR_02425 [Nanoarchaeota archaeon]